MAENEPSRPKGAFDHRLKRMRQHGLKPEYRLDETEAQKNRFIDCGWGRLVFANTYGETEKLVEVLRNERPDRRDIAFYVRDPHVLVGSAPQELFLDPSHTFRLDLATYRPARNRRKGFTVRRLSSRSDAEAINELYLTRGMVPVPPEFFWSQLDPHTITVLVAEEDETGVIVGTAMGVDHSRATNDADLGSSLWCLAVSPQARFPGIGEALVRRMAGGLQRQRRTAHGPVGASRQRTCHWPLRQTRLRAGSLFHHQAQRTPSTRPCSPALPLKTSSTLTPPLS